MNIFKKRESYLNYWHIENRGTYYALSGIVTNDARFPDGDTVHTSMLMKIDFEHNVAETRNTIYHLS